MTQTSTDKDGGGRGRQPARGRALARGLAAAAVLSLLLLGAGAYVAPWLIRDQVLGYVQKTYHRTARLERVSVDLVRWRVEADGFSLPDTDGTPMLAFSSLGARLDLLALLHGEVVLTDVDLVRPRARIVRRPDGRLNFADLAPPAGPKSETPRKPIVFRVGAFRLDDGAVTWLDRQRGEPLARTLRSVTLRLHDFSTTTDGASVSLIVHTDRGETLSWRGRFGLAPLQSSGRLELKDVDVDALSRTLALDWPMAHQGGRLDLQGAYVFRLREGRPDLQATVDAATLSGVGLGPKGEAPTMVSLGVVGVKGVRLDLLRRDVAVSALSLRGAALTARLQRSGLNLVRLAPRSDPKAPRSPPWTVKVDDIDVGDARLGVIDRTAVAPVEATATRLNLHLKDAGLPFVRAIKVWGDAVLDDGATIAADGEVGPPDQAAGGAAFNLTIDGLQLDRFQPYVTKMARVRLKGGDLSGKGRLTWTPKAGIVYRGRLEVDDLRTADPDLKQDLVAWDALAVEGLTLKSQPLSVDIQTVRASGPYARVVLESNYDVNIRAVLESPEPRRPAGAASLDLSRFKFSGPHAKAAAAQLAGLGKVGASKPLLPLAIRDVEVENGRMDFTDLTVLPHFSAGVVALNGRITGVSSSPSSRADVDLKGEAGAFAPVAIKGRMNLLAATTFTDMAMSFRNMELTTFSPYSGKFAGYQIEKGKLTIDFHYVIDHQKLDATHHVVVDQLQLGDKVDSSDAVKLPIKLIIALLKDKNGVIDLPIDISGSLDDPKFKIWPVIWKVVENIFGKIAAAPFSLLGKLAGGGGEETGVVAFAAGSAVIAPDQAQKIQALSKALVERPTLSVDIPLTENPALDRPALEAAAYQSALANAAIKAAPKGSGPDLARALLTTDRGRRKVLEVLYRQEFGRPPTPPSLSPTKGDPKPDPDKAAISWLEAEIRPQLKVADRDLQRLAEARAEAVQAALIRGAGLDPKRVFVIAAGPAEGGAVEMRLQLH